ncbi:MAG: Na+/H+ antiporter NhaA [Gordonia sp. (in: high G+C Gram-positive bacteria)]
MPILSARLCDRLTGDPLARDRRGGALLLGAAVIALCWANSPWRASYHDLLGVEIGPSSVHLHLSLARWAADGLLALFFFTVGVELKAEIVAGSLRDVRAAGVPIVAAVAGMLTPAACYAVIVAATGGGDAGRGWAIPTATDIAFALAVLAIVGRGLPGALRIFLLTLAVVDDLLGILVIATVYTDHIDVTMLVAALGMIAVFAVVVRGPRPLRWLLVPIGVLAWGFTHVSGVHATVAGVLAGMTVPVAAIGGESRGRAAMPGHAVTPWSSLVAVPVFAFAAAGVTVIGTGPVVTPVSVGIVAGLVIGKVVGVLGSVALVVRVTPLRLSDGLRTRDLIGVGMLTGIGFTVALLIADLSFPGADENAAPAKAAIGAGSLIAAVIGAVLLRRQATVQPVAAV